jgi:hypothetical protein
MTAVSDCLSLLLRQTLFGRFGDLEAVWADAGLRESLLNLPVQVMELLLSSDNLKVGSVLLTCNQAWLTHPVCLSPAHFGAGGFRRHSAVHSTGLR